MKKIILPTLVAATLGGLSLPLVACNKNPVIGEDAKIAIEEFVGNEEKGIAGIASVPRPSGHCGRIAEYLQARVQELAPEINDITIDDYHSIWFTIPASSGCQNWTPIIIQGHTDIVSAGQTEEESLTDPIIPEIEGNLMHSKDHKTSLGADNGIGLGMILTLVRQRNDFNHGPIRCICTADEEIGLIGAEHISVDALKYNDEFIPYLLNEDNEEENTAYRSCAGNFLDKYYRNYAYLQNETEEPLSNGIEISLDGLHGGHSGIDIVDNCANADRLIFEFLSYLVNNKGLKTQLIEYNHEKVIEGQTVDIKWQTNQLIQNGHVIFLTDAPIENIKELFDEQKEEWKKLYNEDFDNLDISIKPYQLQDVNHYIHIEDSQKLISLIGSNRDKDHCENGMFYGVFGYFEGEKRPLASANIGPISIKDNHRVTFFECEDLVRSAVANDHEYAVAKLEEKYKTASENRGISNVVHMSGYTPWVSPTVNPFMDMVVDAYKQQDINVKIIDTLGGVEPAWFTSADHNPNLLCSCIGPRIENCHTQQETLHLDTIQTCIDVTKAILAMMEPKI